MPRYLRIVTAVLIVMLVTSAISRAQAPQESLYLRALRACLDQRAKQYGSVLSRSEMMTAVVERDELLLDAFPAQLGPYQVEFVSAKDLKARHSATKRPVAFHRIGPMRNIGNRLLIVVAQLNSTSDQSGPVLALEGTCRVVFQYSCESREWYIDEVTLDSL